jgi:hypothetical protein
MNEEFKEDCYKIYFKATRTKQLIKPKNCSKCGKTGRIHGHHNDYKKPLEIEWLCVQCHESYHHSGDKNYFFGGKKMTQEIKDKISKSCKKLCTEEWKKNVSELTKKGIRDENGNLKKFTNTQPTYT